MSVPGPIRAPDPTKTLLRTVRSRWNALANIWHARQKIDVFPVAVGKKKKYIFFPGYGAVLTLALFILMIFAINYNNNLGIASICFLFVLFMHSGYQNHFAALRPLKFVSMTADPSEVGQLSALRCRFVYDKKVKDYPIFWLEIGGGQFTLEFEADGTCEVVVPFVAEESAVFHAPRMQVATRWPHSVTMTWVHLKLPTVIAVVPAPHALPGSVTGDDDEAQNRPVTALEGEVSGIRLVHPQEKTSKISWKPTWRHNAPMTYVWEDSKSSCVLIRWPEGPDDVVHKIQWVRDRLHAATTANKPFQVIHPDFVSKVGAGEIMARSILAHLMIRQVDPVAWPLGRT